MRRTLFAILGLLVLLWPASRPSQAARLQDTGGTGPARARYVCVPSLIWRNPELCPSYGPGVTRYRIASIRLPNPLPELPVIHLPHDEQDVVPRTYAHVKTLPLNVYRHPMEAAMGLPPVRAMLSGTWWVSVDGLVEYEGQKWYQINRDEFVPAEALAFGSPSRFQGVYLTEQPQRPFAWINRRVQPSVVPGGAKNTAVPALNRFQLVTIFAEEWLGDQLWYLVGADQWVLQENVSRVDVDAPPEGVPAGAKWIEVDLFEQTIAAYEGTRMVYATLVSGGRRGIIAPLGLHRVWAKVREGKMSNPDVSDGHPRYYYYEDVPWTLYFYKEYSIHAAYWHNVFGFRRSYGCINLAPRDAQWFFHWADPPIPDGVRFAYVGSKTPSTWVWVHVTPPQRPSSAHEGGGA